MTDPGFLALLRCPTCGRALQQLDHATLRCDGGHDFPVVSGIPRFVGSNHYAETFGYQWNRFRRVQLDSYNGSGFSARRLQLMTGWKPEDLRGKLVLDAGCGAGRFAEIVAGFGARLVAVDLSSAIDAAAETIAGRAWLAQASIFNPPLAAGAFDVVYCIGVIQHTPDPARAIRALCRLVRPGGQIALWIYEKTWKAYVGTMWFKYAFRPVTSRLSQRANVRFAETLVALCYPIVKLCRRLGWPGRIVTRLLPVAAAHLHDVTLSDDDLRGWLVLDTLDMYSPAYDSPQRWDDIVAILRAEGFEDIRRHPHGALSITATRMAKPQ